MAKKCIKKAEENLSAKCTECSFNPNVNKEVAKYHDAELGEARGTWLTSELTLGGVVHSSPLFWNTLYEYTDNEGNYSSRI